MVVNLKLLVEIYKSYPPKTPPHQLLKMFAFASIRSIPSAIYHHAAGHQSDRTRDQRRKSLASNDYTQRWFKPNVCSLSGQTLTLCLCLSSAHTKLPSRYPFAKRHGLLGRYLR